MFKRDFNFKMVIILRKDLKLSKGQAAIYASHVAVNAVIDAKRKKSNWLRDWFSEGQKKVVVQVPSEEELVKIYEKSKTENLPGAIVSLKNSIDESKEDFVAVAIGPAPNTKITDFTRDLKLM
ncbi:MAG: aminoacyl-tRNA hydrolase [Asgard group archaeon]|nr:aminoacyl-tRNA hydrolase [Asgard group archaeon]